MPAPSLAFPAGGKQLPPPLRSSRGFDVRLERYRDLFEHEGMALCALEAAHWDELNPDEPLRPNRQFYLDLDDQQRFLVFTVRDAAHSLLGYLKLRLSGDPRRADLKIAAEEGWYLHPSVRKGLLGVTLLRAVEQVTEAAGIDELHLTAYDATRAGKLIETLGYEPVLRLYRKKLRS